MMNIRALCAFAMVVGGGRAVAGELRVYPSEVTITGPKHTQQIIVVDEEGGRVTKDLTAVAKFVVSGDPIASVSSGRITATGQGMATVTANVLGRTATVKVTVRAHEAAAQWTFRNHVIPELTRAGCNSGACHGALAGKGGMKLSLRGFDPESDWFVLTRQAVARRVDLIKPTRSLMLRKAARLIPHGGGRRFVEGDDNYNMLLAWIRGGACGPSASDVQLDHVEVYPRAALLKPKEVFQVVVRAFYSNGENEDVTQWSRFTSSEEVVVGVNDEGSVTVNGHGEAAVVVTFGTKVTTVAVTSPYANAVGPADNARAQRNNFIDDLAFQKLELLRLPPSGDCTDAEFVRRALSGCRTAGRLSRHDSRASQSGKRNVQGRDPSTGYIIAQ